MKTLQIFKVLIAMVLIAISSCSQIKDDNRVVMKGKGDELLVINLPAAACEKCQKVIEDGLSKEKGVKQSILNLKTKEVSIVYDAQIISQEILHATVTKLNFEMPCK